MMTIKKILVPVCLLMLLLFVGSIPSPNISSDLEGSWTMIKYKYGSEQELSEVPDIITYVKHLTSTHFSWASYGENGNLIAAGGGRYEVAGNKYREYIDYFHPLGSNLPGSSVEFEYSLSGNDWTISGFVKNIQINPGSGEYESVDSVRLEEVWRRI